MSCLRATLTPHTSRKPRYVTASLISAAKRPIRPDQVALAMAGVVTKCSSIAAIVSSLTPLSRQN